MVWRPSTATRLLVESPADQGQLDLPLIAHGDRLEEHENLSRSQSERSPRTGGLYALFGRARFALRRATAGAEPVLRLERRLPFGRVWLEEEIPLKKLGVIRAFREQGSTPSQPLVTVGFGNPRLASHYLTVDEADARSLVDTLRRWRGESLGDETPRTEADPPRR
jgi:hypothetical protein